MCDDTDILCSQLRWRLKHKQHRLLHRPSSQPRLGYASSVIDSVDNSVIRLSDQLGGINHWVVSHLSSLKLEYKIFYTISHIYRAGFQFPVVLLHIHLACEV